MKNLIPMIVLAAMAGSAMAQPGQDGSVRFESTSPYGGRNGGGEFIFSSVTGPSFGTFISFCIEINEHVTVGSTYTYDINTAAVHGGAGGGSPDPLDIRTAALYHAFVNGTLAYYDYDNSGDGGLTGQLDRLYTAAALQAAIWEIEEERTVEQTESGSGSNAVRIRALARYYVDVLAQQLVDAGLGGNVRVLNLWNSNNGSAQDILVIIPLPQAGALAGLGLAGMAIRRRRPTL